jgi:hypothetical protein
MLAVPLNILELSKKQRRCVPQTKAQPDRPKLLGTPALGGIGLIACFERGRGRCPGSAQTSIDNYA